MKSATPSSGHYTGGHRLSGDRRHSAGRLHKLARGRTVWPVTAYTFSVGPVSTSAPTPASLELQPEQLPSATT